MVNPMDTYNRVKEKYPQAKAEADAFLQSLTKKYTEDKPAPPELIQQGLEDIIAKYETKKRIQPSAVSAPSLNSEYATLLLGGLATALGFATGVPLLGATALFTTTLMMYNNYQNKYKTA